MGQARHWFEAGTVDGLRRYDSLKAARLFPIVFIVEQRRDGTRRIPLPANRTVKEARAEYWRGQPQQLGLLDRMA